MKRLILLIFLFGCLIRLAAANEPEAAPGYCAVAQARIGGELVAWLEYPQGWDLPEDLRLTDVFNYPQDGGLLKYSSASDGADYYFDFWSWRWSGEPLGQHDFCGPYRVESQP